MKLEHIKYILLFALILLLGRISAQQRLMMNGGVINISNGAKLVIENPATNAITRTSGQISSGNENNNIVWRLGNTTGTYTIPWGSKTTGAYIPITFTKSAGTGAGYFTFSTFHSNMSLDSLPAGVTNVSRNGTDKAPFIVKRFWGINALSYTTKPTLTNMIFTYIDSEVDEGSSALTEGALTVQRWNSNINDWGDFSTGITIDTVQNKITVPTVSGANLFRWWIITSFYETLPVELTEFKGACKDGKVELNWKTASEMNSDYFTVERSGKDNEWKKICTIKAAGNSNVPFSYTYTDADNSEDTYYRLKQTDKTKVSTYSSVIQVSCGNNTTTTTPVNLVSNDGSGVFRLKNAPVGGKINIININGQPLFADNLTDANQEFNIGNLANGIYILNVNDGINNTSFKLVINR